MSIAPIGAAGIGNVAPVSPSTSTSAAGKADAEGFGDTITKALDELDKLHQRTDSLATQAATGDLDSVTDYVVAATEAQLATQVTAAIRNKAVEAFNDIMRMPV